MVSIASLWLPILLSAVAVFVVSSVIHMFLGYHAADYKKVPAEDELMAAVRKLDIPPGDYMVPCPTSHRAFKDAAFLEKFKAGPRAMMTVLPSGPITMAPQLVQWFLYTLLIGITAAYISGRALGPGAHRYRFIVDGEWRDDPECKSRVPNPFGGVNSLLTVTG